MTGCEGYVEIRRIGLLAGRYRRRRAARRSRSRRRRATTALGALLGHITGGHIETIDAGPRSFQPMNINFGLFPPLAQMRRPRSPTASGCAATKRPSPRSRRLSARALADLDRWIAEHLRVAAAA